MKRTWILAATYLGGGALALWLASGAVAKEAELPPEVTDKLRALDKDGDGKLQPAEAPFGAEAFARGDRDRDGALSFLEAYRVYLLQEARKKAKQGEVERRFRAADADGDGVVTRAEFPGPESLFKRMDKDGDGKLVPDEALRVAIEEELAEAFTKYDRDLSGTLSEAELPESTRPFFVAADLDGDGQLSGEEAFAFVYETRRAATAASGQPAPLAPAPARPKAQPAVGATAKLGVLLVLLEQLPALDADADGALSLEEMGATADLFKRLDADGDGKVDRAELELRKGFAVRLAERGKALRPRVERAGMQAALSVLAKELEGLFFAGRYEEVAALLDRIELRLTRREQSLVGKQAQGK